MMNFKKYFSIRTSRQLLLLVIAFVIILCSCEDEAKEAAAKEKLIMTEVSSRLDYWRKELDKTCRQTALDAASKIVDSTLIAEAKLQRDTLGKLLLPPRPVRPEFDATPDTLQVKPLLKFGRDSTRK
jgi:hypothetical protein